MPFRDYFKKHEEGNGSEQQERFGLFPLVERAGENDRSVDIVAVHGLGGHWAKTWTESSSGALWLRDRLPQSLAAIQAEPKILSFGYDADFVFATTRSDIDDCAKSLLDRLRMSRPTDASKNVPIVFIAHSMGALIVQQAINLAHTDQDYYADILKNVRGCVFLASPLHGSDAARWAELGVHIAQSMTMHFLGNPAHPRALKRNSEVWLRISRDFVQRGKSLTFRSFYETKPTGKKLIVDKASARLNWPNEKVSALENSDHQTICKFGPGEDQRYGPVGQAVAEVVEEALKGYAHHGNTGCRMMLSLMDSTSRIIRKSFEMAERLASPDSATFGEKGPFRS